MPGEFTAMTVGFDQIENNLLRLAEDLGPRRARSVANIPIRNALRPVRAQIEARTPVDSGGLRNSISQNQRIANRRELASGVFDSNDIAVGRVGWFWTGESLWFQSLAVEYGSRQKAPLSVLRDALRDNHQEVLSILGRELGDRIERRAARFAATGR